MQYAQKGVFPTSQSSPKDIIHIATKYIYTNNIHFGHWKNK